MQIPYPAIDAEADANFLRLRIFTGLDQSTDEAIPLIDAIMEFGSPAGDDFQLAVRRMYRGSVIIDFAVASFTGAVNAADCLNKLVQFAQYFSTFVKRLKAWKLGGTLSPAEFRLATALVRFLRVPGSGLSMFHSWQEKGSAVHRLADADVCQTDLRQLMADWRSLITKHATPHRPVPDQPFGMAFLYVVTRGKSLTALVPQYWPEPLRVERAVDSARTALAPLRRPDAIGATFLVDGHLKGLRYPESLRIHRVIGRVTA